MIYMFFCKTWYFKFSQENFFIRQGIMGKQPEQLLDVPVYKPEQVNMKKE